MGHDITVCKTLFTRVSIESEQVSPLEKLLVSPKDHETTLQLK